MDDADADTDKDEQDELQGNLYIWLLNALKPLSKRNGPITTQLASRPFSNRHNPAKAKVAEIINKAKEVLADVDKPVKVTIVWTPIRTSQKTDQ